MSSGAQRDIVAIQNHREPLGLQRRADVVQPRRVEGGEWLAAPQAQRPVDQFRGFERIRGYACA
jgi:hypothetical protein